MKIKSHYVYILALVAISLLVTYLNLGFTKTIAGEDYGLAYDYPNLYFKAAIFNWDHLSAPGKPSVTSTISLIWYSAINLFSVLGLNAQFISRLVYFLFHFTSGVGIFVLVKLLARIHYKEKNLQSVEFAAFTGSLLYMFNHFTMAILAHTITPYYLSFMLLPWLFYFFVYNVHKRSTLSSLILFVFTLLVLANGNPSNTISILVLLFVYLAFFFNDLRKDRYLLRFIIGSAVLTILMTAYIYLPMLSLRANPYGDTGSLSQIITSFYYNSNNTSFTNLFRLAGHLIWDRFSYYAYYFNRSKVLVGYFIPILVFLCLLSKKSRKIKIFFCLVIFFNLLFAKGTHPPFTAIAETLIKYISPLGMYRAVYLKFTYFISFSYAILLAFTVFELHILLARKRYRHVLLLIPLIVCYYAFPFFSRQQILYKDLLTQLPTTYPEMREVINKVPGEYKVLSLPPAPSGAGLLLQWDKNNRYVGPHPDAFFVERPVFDAYWFTQHKYKNLTAEDSWTGTRFENNIDDIVKIASKMNIKYFLIHRDFVNQYDFAQGVGTIYLDSELKYKTLEKRLNKNPEVKKITSNSNLSLYRIEDNVYPLIYAPRIHLFSDKPFNELFKTDSTADLQVILPKTLPFAIKRLSATPDLDFKLLNPTKYEVTVRNMKEPFTLALLESFDSNWHLYLQDSKKSTSKQIAKNTHMLANGYANAWYINSSDVDKKQDFTLIIEFGSQEHFYFGLAISSITFVLSLLTLLTSFIKRNISYTKHSK